jgi:hypothetical protein
MLDRLDYAVEIEVKEKMKNIGIFMKRMILKLMMRYIVLI